ncbi:septum site-determining protein Ssd [Spirillospora sp. NPDC127200]
MTSAAMIVTTDPALADDLLRLAAAAAVRADLAQSAAQARTGWYSRPLVLVGPDLAGDIAAEGLPRRPGVVLVAGPDAPPDVHRLALEAGAQDLAVLPAEEPWLIDALATAAEPPGRAMTVCFRGAMGGVGTSVLAATFALTAARAGLRTLLVDGDPAGGGLDLLLGVEDAEGARWPEFAERRGRLSPATLRDALPRLDELAVLSWRQGVPVPVSEEGVLTVLGAASRGFDLVVVDVPKNAGTIGGAALRTADVGFLVVPHEIRPIVAASSLRDAPADLRLIVTGPSPGGLTSEVAVQALDLPLAGVLERDRRIPAALEEADMRRVTRRGPLPMLCGRLLKALPFPQSQSEAA